MTRLALAAVRGVLLAGVATVSAGEALAHPSPAEPRSAGAHAAQAPARLPHVVQPGETLSGVAFRTGASMASLARANKISDVNRIRAGDRLVVPGGSPGPVARTDPKVSNRLPARLQERPERVALLPRFDSAAREFGVPADLLKAITWQESGWQNDRVSSTKARGIGQLMPDTVAFVNGSLLRARLDPGRPDDNIRMSARFLAYLLHRTNGDVSRAVAAYYQGLGSVQRRGPYPSTIRYTADVLALRRKF